MCVLFVYGMVSADTWESGSPGVESECLASVVMQSAKIQSKQRQSHLNDAILQHSHTIRHCQTPNWKKAKSTNPSSLLIAGPYYFGLQE